MQILHKISQAVFLVFHWVGSGVGFEKARQDSDRDIRVSRLRANHVGTKEGNKMKMQDERDAVLIADLTKRKKELETRLVEISEDAIPCSRL